MKLNLQKTLIASLALLVSLCSWAQTDFQGVAHYMSKTSINTENFGRPDMSEEQKKRIAERMKSMFEKTYTLTFNQTESLYKEDETLEAPGQDQGRRGFGAMMSSSFTGGPEYKNVKTNQLLQEQEFFGKQFLVKDTLPKYEWQMTGETKQIGQYTCFKATATIKSTAVGFEDFRPPRREEGEEAKEEETKPKEPKSVDIVAWYTMQIPVNQGPADYWGLPGLILEVNAGKTTILCTKIVVNPEEKTTIKEPKKGKEVSKEEYNEIVKKKTEEMRNNFRNRRNGPGGNRR
ncbi:GLPGLI family protein [Neotamlana laminarinivorans]|uniref:GLPGLI family protein n=1 Tax=Neotamlana laminarinivorans TaxID=2883124 RepID=A0A9X1L4Q5_9FLAO|nr:GLPGLI family protein [Tamlana laminarinivorans]MCB4798566.1 GLPGLI family protein [Tamlana laminarinivorans]